MLDVGALARVLALDHAAGHAPPLRHLVLRRAPRPTGTTYLHDDAETVASTWVTAGDALRARRDARRARAHLPDPQPRGARPLRLDAADLLAAVDDALAPPATRCAEVRGNGGRCVCR